MSERERKQEQDRKQRDHETCTNRKKAPPYGRGLNTGIPLPSQFLLFHSYHIKIFCQPIGRFLVN